MKAMHLIASTFVAAVLLGGCSRDEPVTPTPIPPETPLAPHEQPRNELDLPVNRTTEDPIEPTTDNPYTPTEDPYAPTGEQMGEGVDGVSPPADDNLPE